MATFYANLFGKVFWYLGENDPGQDWIAVAIFESRNLEPKQIGPYEDLLRSPRVKRIYLDEYSIPPDPPWGLSILQLISASEDQAKPLVARLLRKAEVENADSELRRKVIDLLEELLLRRFTQLDREEVGKMFQLHDLHKSKVWREAHEEGREEGREEGKSLAQAALVRKCVAKGMSVKEIAALMEIPVARVRRLAKQMDR